LGIINLIANCCGCFLIFWAIVNERSLLAGTVAATYVLLLQHSSKDVAAEASQCLMRELEFLKERKVASFKDGAWSEEPFSREAEVQSSDALFRFDLMLFVYKTVLLESPALKVFQAEQAHDLTELILDKLNPLEDPLHGIHVCSWLYGKSYTGLAFMALL